MEIVAVAKDGHVIYGPWDANGNQWTCDSHDVCGGSFFSDGSYGYMTVTTFPYSVGCFGPGAAQSVVVPSSCSNTKN